MKFVHQELNTSDPAAAKKFYKGLFGWKVKDMKMPDGGKYGMIEVDGAVIGGIQQHPMPGNPSSWVGYVGVASVKKALAKVVKLGGTVVVDYTALPMGALGVFKDPTGAVCALWEPAMTAAAAPAAKKSGKKIAKKVAKKAGKKAGK